jgi:molecular chaperone GrpE
MLRQSISTTSKALRATARLGTQRQTIALAQRHQTPLVAARAIAPRTRWYSSETDAAKKNGEEAKKEGEAESPEAALKKQLEAKEVEVRDLKVRI